MAGPGGQLCGPDQGAITRKAPRNGGAFPGLSANSYGESGQLCPFTKGRAGLFIGVKVGVGAIPGGQLCGQLGASSAARIKGP